jgi:hypothetical protein
MMGTLGDEPADGAEVRLLASLISSSQLPPPRPSQAWLLRCVQSAACKRHGSAHVRPAGCWRARGLWRGVVLGSNTCAVTAPETSSCAAAGPDCATATIWPTLLWAHSR